MTSHQTDPVCGMHVDPDQTTYVYDYQDTRYFFCCESCLNNFKKDPQKYLQSQSEKSVDDRAAEYTCPMHPQIIQDHPGNCPICGMALEPKTIESGPDDDSEYKDMRLKLILGIVLSIPLVFLAMTSMFPAFNRVFSPHISHWLQFLFSTPVVLWAGGTFFQRGFQSIKNRNLNMFSLISLGVGFAYFYSLIAFFFPHLFPSSFRHQGEVPLYFETAALITVLVLLGQVLELKARSQTSLAIKALLGRAAKSAKVVENGAEREIPIDQVKVGDILHVLPGDKIPVDGSLMEGKSYVDESMVTGEAMPVEKEAGHALIGGTINGQGSFLMRADKVGRETLLSRIIGMVAEAQRTRAPIQSLADKVSSYFVPAVVIIACLTFILWTWLGPEPSFVYGLVNAVAVLIIACPCALGLATPMSIMVGMGRGADAGVLIKNAGSLEKLEKVNTVIVDKTGTLTEGKPEITLVVCVESENENEVLRLAAALEQNSEHPIAGAIIRKVRERQISLPKAEDFQSFPGNGISGKSEGYNILVGNRVFFEERNVEGVAYLLQKAKELQSEAQTVIFVAKDGRAIGMIMVGDEIKASAYDAVRELHQLNLKIMMLSGDNERTVQLVAKKLGVDEAHAQVTPSDKQLFVDLAKNKFGFVAMAGDGINDAPALASADIGIAMGTGTDVAMESADITLVKGDLTGIVRAVRLSRAVMRNIRQNLFFAFFYNILGIPIAAGLLYPFTGLLLNPVIAALAMSLSSVSVIVNSLRLKKVKL